jgi:hypothetical protein
MGSGRTWEHFLYPIVKNGNCGECTLGRGFVTGDQAGHA